MVRFLLISLRAKARLRFPTPITFGQKIVSLGGVPSVEIGTAVHQSTDLEEMLQQDLALEKEAMQAYLEAHALAEGNVALRSMLENHIEGEQEDIEELEMYLGMVEDAKC